ncbi:hypothetical protein HS048_06520 [Planomonospora sp. ID91781]|uniref:glycosyl hydrolase n=1 Tax=Planomonospora sp. ID91781 TaxID=2738135 RepID=UPI0018C3A448|nr:glycosyl hydrolase [Planomonospora sp. ID91781]MBG0820390.1 hypothetical protein [Planomonospora sp. ID91781]
MRRTGFVALATMVAIAFSAFPSAAEPVPGWEAVPEATAPVPGWGPDPEWESGAAEPAVEPEAAEPGTAEPETVEPTAEPGTAEPVPGPESSPETAGSAPEPFRVQGRKLMFGAVGQYREEILGREQELGQPLEAVRVFKRWDEPVFNEHQVWARDTGHTIFVSVKSRRKDGSDIRWRDIADAQPGSELHSDIVRQAQELRDFGAVVYFTFNHEPEAKGSRAMGEGADFVDAWRKIVDVHWAQGVRLARYVWTVTPVAFDRTDHTSAELFYPGDDYVDHIAADAYNFYNCSNPEGKWLSLAEVIEGHRRFGLRHPDKGLMLLEWGSVEDPAQPGRRAEWLADATRTLLSPGYEQYRAVLAWDARNLDEEWACDFDYASTSDALAAWREMGSHSAFGAEGPCEIGDCVRMTDFFAPSRQAMRSRPVRRGGRRAR